LKVKFLVKIEVEMCQTVSLVQKGLIMTGEKDLL